MNKKDRIALVLSTPPLVLGLITLPEGGAGFIFILPVFAYWGYRFIKGDISFTKGGH